MANPTEPVEDAEDITPTTVDTSDDGGDQEPADTNAPAPEGDQVPGATPTQQQARGQRPQPGREGPRQSKGNYRDMVAGQAALTTQIQTLTQTVQQQQSIIQGLMQQRGSSADQQQPGGQGKGSETDQEIAGLVGEMNQIMELVRAGNLTAEQADTYSRRYQSLDDKRRDLRVQSMIEKAVAPLAQQRGAGGGGDAATEHARGVLQVEFPEVTGDPSASKEARSYYNYLVDQGRQDGLDLLREACAHVATRRGLGGRRLGPSRASQAARSGVPNGAHTVPDDGAITFDRAAMRQIRGAGVSPEQIAAEFLRQRGSNGA